MTGIAFVYLGLYVILYILHYFGPFYANFVDSVTSLMFNPKSNNFSTYKTKVDNLVKSQNIIQLTKEMVWNPNILLSVNNTTRYGVLMPLLGTLRIEDSKSRELIWGCLVHFAANIIGDGKDKKDGYMSKYLNYLNLKRIVTVSSFYGVIVKLLEDESQYVANVSYSFIERIMKHDAFNGLSQMSYDEGSKVFHRWCTTGNKTMISLLLKYYKKNEQVITNGINYIEKGKKFSSFGKPALVTLVTPTKSKKAVCNDELLQLLLFEIKKVIPQSKIDEAILKQCYNICKNETKNEAWAQMFEKYAKETGQSVE